MLSAGQVWGIVTDQINAYFGVLGSSLNDLSQPLTGFRAVMSNIWKFLFSVLAQTMGKAASSTSVFVHYLVKIRRRDETIRSSRVSWRVLIPNNRKFRMGVCYICLSQF
jgi:hypothetical protein